MIQADKKLAGTSVQKTDTQRPWSLLAELWSIYYFVVFSLGRYEEYTQKIIWIAGAVVVAATAITMIRKKTRIPIEGWLLFGLAFWTLTGLAFVSDWGCFMRHFQLIVEMAIVISCISVVLANGGSMRWLYFSFIATVLFNVLVGLETVSYTDLTDTSEKDRAAGMMDNPNGFGYMCFIGVVGAQALVGSKSSWLMRAVAGLSSLVSLYGLLIAASRGAFVALLLAVVLWPMMCWLDRSKRKILALILIPLMVLVAYYLFQFAMENTYLGVRMDKSSRLEDNSSYERRLLITTGLGIAFSNPIVGCGLGQYAAASKTGLYAHNEFIELIATTGLPGFLLYYSVYGLVWLRLSRNLRYLQDSAVRYQVNMARMILLIVVVSGLLFRPNFFSIDTIFLIAVVTGVSHWADQLARANSQPKAQLKICNISQYSLFCKPRVKFFRKY